MMRVSYENDNCTLSDHRARSEATKRSILLVASLIVFFHTDHSLAYVQYPVDSSGRTPTAWMQ